MSPPAGTDRYPPFVAKRRYSIFTREEGKRLPRIAMRSWTFVVVVGVLLTVLSVIDRGGLATARSAGGMCRFAVDTATLNVRAEPSVTSAQVDQLARGVEVSATSILTGGFRKLSEGHWALDQYLTPLVGATCV